MQKMIVQPFCVKGRPVVSGHESRCRWQGKRLFRSKKVTLLYWSLIWYHEIVNLWSRENFTYAIIECFGQRESFTNTWILGATAGWWFIHIHTLEGLRFENYWSINHNLCLLTKVLEDWISQSILSLFYWDALASASLLESIITTNELHLKYNIPSTPRVEQHSLSQDYSSENRERHYSRNPLPFPSTTQQILQYPSQDINISPPSTFNNTSIQSSISPSS